MEDYFLSTPLNDQREICISPISHQTYKESGGKGLGGDLGYFIYEIDRGDECSGYEILAKAASIDAALKLYEIICNGADRLRSTS